MKSASTILEDLVHDRFYEQEQETYSPQQFIQTLMELQKKHLLFYCPYDDATLNQFYHQIAKQNQTQRLGYETILQFISKMKEMNQQNLIKQIEFYQRQVKKNLQKNINTISRKEFRKITDRFSSDRQLITQMMIKNIEDAKYVSCQKILTFIEEIRVQIEKPLSLGLTISKFRNKLNSSQRNFVPNSSKIGMQDQIVKTSNILEAFSQHPLKLLLNQYMQIWHRKLNFYRQFVSDEQIIEDMDNFNQQTFISEERINDEANNVIDYLKDLQKKGHEFEQIYGTLNDQKKIEQSIINKQQHQIAELKDQLTKLEKQIQNQMEQNQVLRQNLDTVKTNLIKMAIEYEEIEKEYTKNQKDYRQLKNEYYNLTEAQTYSNEMLVKLKEEKEKNTTEMTFKQKLAENVQRLQTMLSTKEMKLKQFEKKDENHINTIINLQHQLEQLQKELKQKRQYLSRSNYPSNCLEDGKKSRIIQEQFPNENSQRKGLIKSESNFRKTTNNLPAFMNKLKIKLGVTQVISEVQESVFENQILSKRQIATIIQSDNSLHNKSKRLNIFSKKTSLQVDQIRDFKKYNSEQINKSQTIPLIQIHNPEDISNNYFVSKGIKINSQGDKFEVILLLTQKRFCYFDKDVKVPHFMPISNIKSIIFCYHNPNLIVIRLKNIERNNQQHLIYQDMTFSLRQRSKLVAFLSKKFTDRLIKNEINIYFKREEDIFLTINKKQLNLKISIPNINHPLRLCISGQPVFYGNIAQPDRILNFDKDCCFIIQPMGILCFKGDETQQIGKKQLLFILPLIENIKIHHNENYQKCVQKQLYIDYQNDQKWKKSYRITFSSKNLAIQFTMAAESQIKKNSELKYNNFSDQSKLYDSIQKLHSSPTCQ